MVTEIVGEQLQKLLGKVTHVHCQVLMDFVWIWSVFSLMLWAMER